MSQLILGIQLQEKPRESCSKVLEIIAVIKQESEKAAAIAREMYGEDVGDLARLPNAQFIQVWEEYHQRAGTKIRPLREMAQAPQKVSPYRPWSIERKQRNRVHKLKTRMRKKYSFPALWIEAMQAKLLDMPQYFWVCPLPSTAKECPVYLSDRIPNPAKLREIELRDAEYRLYLTKKR